MLQFLQSVFEKCYNLIKSFQFSRKIMWNFRAFCHVYNNDDTSKCREFKADARYFYGNRITQVFNKICAFESTALLKPQSWLPAFYAKPPSWLLAPGQLRSIIPVVRALDSQFRGSPDRNHWVVLSSTQPFIFPRSIIWVLGISGNLVVKSELPPLSGSVVLI